MKVYNVITEKGGTGKTETVKNISFGLSNKGKRILVIDLDPQANSTGIILKAARSVTMKSIQEMSMDFKENNDSNDLYGIQVISKYVNKKDYKMDSGDVLLNPKDIEAAIVHTDYDNLDIIPASPNLRTADMKLKMSGAKMDTRLSIALDKIEDKYDYVIIDNSPFINAIGINGINACHRDGDTIIIPIKIDQGGLEGLDSTFKQLDEAITFDENLGFDFMILPTMVNRTSIEKKTVELLHQLFPNRVYDTAIRYQSKPVVQSSLEKKILLGGSFKYSGVACDYDKLVDELLSRE